SNVEEFGGWLRTLRGETDIIVTDKRPVPLTQYMMVGSKIMRLFSKNAEHLAGEDHPGAINRSLLTAVGKAEAYGNQRGPRREDVVRHLEQTKMLPRSTSSSPASAAIRRCSSCSSGRWSSPRQTRLGRSARSLTRALRGWSQRICTCWVSANGAGR